MTVRMRSCMLNNHIDRISGLALFTCITTSALGAMLTATMQKLGRSNWEVSIGFLLEPWPQQVLQSAFSFDRTLTHDIDSRCAGCADDHLGILWETVFPCILFPHFRPHPAYSLSNLCGLGVGQPSSRCVHHIPGTGSTTARKAMGNRES